MPNLVRRLRRTGRLGRTAGLAALGLFTSAMAHAENYALLIGVNEYESPAKIRTLTCAVNDAIGLKKTLVEFCDYKSENIMLLSTSSAKRPTRREIMRQVQEITGKVERGDNVFVFYSGHGMEIDGVTYLLPYDTDWSDRGDVKIGLTSTALRASDLRDALNKIRANCLVMAFDMCRSDPTKAKGEAIGSRTVKAAREEKFGEAQKRDLVVVRRDDGTGPKNVITLFSCSPGEASWEWRERGRGFFAWFMEEGLKGDADANADGKVQAYELLQYLDQKVAPAVMGVVSEKQSPYADQSGIQASSIQLSQVPKNFTAQKQQEELQKLELAKKQQEEAKAQASYLAKLKLQEEAAKQKQQMEMAAKLEMERKEKEQALAELKAKQQTELKARYEDIVIRGYEYFMEGKNQEAQKCFQEAKTMLPATPRADVGLGWVMVYFKKNNEASKLFSSAVTANYDNALTSQAMNGLAIIAANARQFNKAEEQYLKALEVDPGDVWLRCNLAKLYFRDMNKGAEATKQLEEAMTRNPKHPRPYFTMGEYFIQQRDAKKAEDQFRKAIALSLDDADKKTKVFKPDVGNYYANLAATLKLLNRESEARAAAGRARELGYTDPQGILKSQGL